MASYCLSIIVSALGHDVVQVDPRTRYPYALKGCQELVDNAYIHYTYELRIVLELQNYSSQ